MMSLRLSRTRKTLTTTVRWEILIRTQTLTLILILFSTPIPTLLPNLMMIPTLPSIMNLNPLLPPILNPTLATILVLLMNCIQAQIQKAKITASGNDVFESITSNGPSTDFIGDSTTALLEDNFTASDDTLSTTNFASVSDDPMTWSVSPATMVALPKPYPPPSPQSQ